MPGGRNEKTLCLRTIKLEWEGGKRVRKHFVLLPLVVVAIVAGSCVGVFVENGVIRDTLGNVEQTYNGNWRIWFTHDTAAGYCTLDNSLGEYALYLLENHDGEVLLEYKSILAGDSEYSLWNNSDCGSIQKGESSMVMFAVVKITPVSARLRGVIVPGEQ